MYQFSAPMPYIIKDIDKILDINNQVNKSKITSLYACVPRSCEVFTGFEQSRNFALNDVSWNYWKGLIEYTLNKGFDFIYLLNSPRPLAPENPDFPKQLEKLELLLSELKKIGVYKLRIASVQLMTYISKKYPYFEILASTSLEYKTIWEYQNFIHFHPEVKQIVPSHDINKNFLLLRNLKKRYPEIELELMVNEGCLQGCPHRNLHEMYPSDNLEQTNNQIFKTGKYCANYCYKASENYPFVVLCNNTNIFPWEIEEYSKVGINNFKLVGRDSYAKQQNKYPENYLIYLQTIDNCTESNNCAIVTFIHHLPGSQLLYNLTVKDVLNLLPKIKYFNKYGHLCASHCGIQCRYCYKCAEKIQKVFEKKQAELRKINVPVCYIN